jgi:hypothetical protein
MNMIPHMPPTKAIASEKVGYSDTESTGVKHLLFPD